MESFYTVKWQGGYVLPLNYMGHVEKKKMQFSFPFNFSDDSYQLIRERKTHNDQRQEQTTIKLRAR